MDFDGMKGFFLIAAVAIATLSILVIGGLGYFVFTLINGGSCAV